MMRSFWLMILFLFLISEVSAQSIVDTKHNLSASAGNSIKSLNESEICIFCHTTHNPSPDFPLWNRENPGRNYNLYSSSTTQAYPGQPDGSSLLCLSCHDGTIALGNLLSRKNPVMFQGGVTTLPTGSGNLRKDLSDDHPVSMVYNSSLAAIDRALKDPSTLAGSPVRLENSKLQCISCHDPHKNTDEDFLVASSRNSALCNYCHEIPSWNTSSHKGNPKSWNGSSPDPWFHTPYNTVMENGCENCHNPHDAGGKVRLMNYLAEENNCYGCHNGNVASKNIQAQFNKTYRHNVAGSTGIHDPMENPLTGDLHVECADCHNSHAANNSRANPPNVQGFNAGVKGIDQNGNAVDPVLYQYQICYRCHTATPGMPGSPTVRKIPQNNVRLEFATTNPSFHPVVGPGTNPNVPSLISPYTASSVLYCTSCHSSDGAGSPEGPHGSMFPHILKMQYLTADNTTESTSAYALCYSCHSRTSILGDVSFREHNRHITRQRTSCNVCHDPHGISSTQGNSTGNSNLINFDISIVTPSSTGILKFEDQGLYRGRCFLSCHGKDHNPLSYQ